MDVIVAGIEGTGTEWMTRVLARHPEVGTAHHQSYPINWTGSPYVPLRQIDPEQSMPVFVMLRDRTCSQNSRARRKLESIFIEREEAKQQLWADISEWQGPVVFLSYEGLIEFGMTYLSRMLSAAGLGAMKSWPHERHPQDGNLKYLRVVQWMGR